MVYKVRVILDTKESIFRDIEIKQKQTLWNLHLGIKSAFSLQGDELSSFYFTDDEWVEGQAIPLEDMSDEGDGEIMSDVYLKEAFPQQGAKMLFKYGFIDLWEFFCELIEIKDEKPAVNYPITVYRFGNVPLKAPGKNGKGTNSLMLDEDFGDIEADFDGESFDDDFEDDFDTDETEVADDIYEDDTED